MINIDSRPPFLLTLIQGGGRTANVPGAPHMLNRPLHEGLVDLAIKIIDKTNIHKPTEREGFWTNKVGSYS